MKKLSYNDGELILGNKVYIMGIVNVTPDSFSDGGKYFDSDLAVAHALKLLDEGADILDFGAMSTRPGSLPVSSEEEIKRLDSVLKSITKKTDAVISVDTVNPQTAEYSLLNGADIINDVSGFFNPEMGTVVKKYNAGWIVTHTGNVPSGTVKDYPNGVLKSVNEFFDSIIYNCSKIGIEREHLCLDPGFGFAKTTADNIELLANLEKTIRDDICFLTALSRKRFIGEITGVKNAEERIAGTVSADIVAAMKGTDMIRVHDVKEAAESLRIYNMIKRDEHG